MAVEQSGKDNTLFGNAAGVCLQIIVTTYHSMTFKIIVFHLYCDQYIYVSI